MSYKLPNSYGFNVKKLLEAPDAQLEAIKHWISSHLSHRRAQAL